VIRAAKVISFIFHPLLLTTYLVLLLGFFYPPMLMIRRESLLPITAFIFVVTFVLPAFNLVAFRYFGNITSLSLTERRERVMPFFLIAFIYLLITGLFYYRLPISINFIKLMVIITTLVLASAIVTLFYKISVHSIAMCGGIGILLPINKAVGNSALLLPTAVVIVATGLVMSSRLLLQAHVPREVLTGSLLGFALGFFGMIILF
jgi:hypothetical protein